ncbi:MAG: hypothetical protein MI743_21885 [Sneathiellales bacterium]|nr:hypothetical protein [Sneathiellales bacterium]
MTRFLVTEENPEGHKLEDILVMVRADIINRCTHIADDRRPEAQAVLTNNMKILALLTDAVELAESSTRILDKAFGPSQAGKGGPPRIGKGSAGD